MAGPRIVRHASEIGQWEMVQAEPPVTLRPYVREYVGWVEHMSSPLCRRELPTEIIPVIINFGSPVRIFERDDLTRWTDHSSFTTGAYDRYVLVGSAGPSGGLQINFTILGARLFLGRPLTDLTNRVVPLDDFREQFGLAPKTLARVLRFGRAVALIKTNRHHRLSDVALDCGYYDQAHFSRDAAEFAGVSPRELVRSFLPDSGGFRVDG